MRVDGTMRCIGSWSPEMTIEESFALLEQRIAALEARLAPVSSAHDLIALKVIANATNGDPFSSASLWARTHTDPVLRGALDAAGIWSTVYLGTWCRRMRWVDTGTLRLTRLRRNRSGYQWKASHHSQEMGGGGVG